MTGIEISFRHQAHVLLTHFFSCDILAPLSKNSSNYNYKIQTSDLSRKMTEKEFWECYNVFVMDNIFKEEAIKLSIPIDLISLVNAQVSKLDQRLSALKEKMENFEKIGKGYIALLLK